MHTRGTIPVSRPVLLAGAVVWPLLVHYLAPLPAHDTHLAETTLIPAEMATPLPSEQAERLRQLEELCERQGRLIEALYDQDATISARVATIEISR